MLETGLRSDREERWQGSSRGGGETSGKGGTDASFGVMNIRVLSAVTMN